jgi:hypothetical protein
MHWLKLAFAKRRKSRTPAKGNGPFWQARGFDRSERDAAEFSNELDYIHHNPVKRGLMKVPEAPEERVEPVGSTQSGDEEPCRDVRRAKKLV